MTTKISALKAVALAALVAAAGAAQAGITVYTSLAAFNAAVGTTGTDTFAGLAVASATSSPLTRPAGIFQYTADAAPAGTFFGAGTIANPWLSTNLPTDTVTFNAFSPGVVAAGGNFFGTDFDGAFTASDVTLSVTDGSATTTTTIVSATTTGFLGFVSDGPLLSMTLVALQPTSGFVWPTVDNLVLASAIAAVPEAPTYAMMLAGLGLMGFMARRRRR